jgi:predicted lipoprotein with Yx(FWY)xxD motif
MQTPRNPKLSTRLATVLTVSTLVLAACGDDDEESSSTTAAAAAPETSAAPAATEPASDRAGYGETPAATEAPATGGASAEGAVALADTGLGQVVTAADGMTMYLFMPDNMGAPTCAADCAEAWPPLLVEGTEVTGGDGIDAALLGTVANPEGGTQVTYGGWPLYYFAGDSAPGDTNGQGQGDVWYAIDAAGQPVP